MRTETEMVPASKIKPGMLLLRAGGARRGHQVDVSWSRGGTISTSGSQPERGAGAQGERPSNVSGALRKEKGGASPAASPRRRKTTVFLSAGSPPRLQQRQVQGGSAHCPPAVPLPPLTFPPSLLYFFPPLPSCTALCASDRFYRLSLQHSAN